MNVEMLSTALRRVLNACHPKKGKDKREQLVPPVAAALLVVWLVGGWLGYAPTMKELVALGSIVLFVAGIYFERYQPGDDA